MYLDIVARISQIVFYVIAASIAILTYISAKKGLLNTVNTEYHKKVIEKISMLSEELYSEFDRLSPNYWLIMSGTEDMIARINKQARDIKHEILTEKFEHRPFGIPVTKEEQRFLEMRSKYKTDPFLPESIRQQTVDLLTERLEAIHDAHVEAIDYYIAFLASNKGWGTLDKNHQWIGNRINKRLYEQVFGVSQVEEKVDVIRIGIQHYFSGFDPLRHEGIAKNALALAISKIWRQPRPPAAA